MSDDVKAGTYELVALMWDEPLSKPGEPFDFIRHRRGDKVKLNVEEARRLLTAGAVVRPGDREKAQVAAAKAALAAAVAAVPEEFRSELGVDVPEPEQSTAPEDPPEDSPTPDPVSVLPPEVLSPGAADGGQSATHRTRSRR